MTVLIVVVIVAIVLFLVNRFIPMDPKTARAFNIVIIGALIVYLIIKLLQHLNVI